MYTFISSLSNIMKHGDCSFYQMFLKCLEIGNLFGTFFSGRLIHIWCCNAYLDQQMIFFFIAEIYQNKSRR